MNNKIYYAAVALATIPNLVFAQQVETTTEKPIELTPIPGLSEAQSITRTVVYNIGEEGEKQDLFYSLEDGGLRIKGHLFTNCCGTHLLNCLVEYGAIYLSRSDMGELCDCQGPHAVDIFIPDIPTGYYTVFLDEYKCEEGVADYAEISETSISAVEGKEYNLSYSKDYISVIFLNKSVEEKYSINIFNIDGTEIWSRSTKDCSITIPKQKLPSNILVCKISTPKQNYTIKLSKNK